MTILVSDKTRQRTKLGDLLAEPARTAPASGKIRAMATAVQSTAPASPQFALVNGEALGKKDRDEQRIVRQAERDNLPLVIENASAEVMAQATGLGLAADVAVVKKLTPNRYRISLLNGGKMATRQDEAAEAAAVEEKVAERMAADAAAPADTEEVATAVSAANVAAQVQSMLDEQASMDTAAEAVGGAGAAARSDEYIYYVNIGYVSMQRIRNTSTNVVQEAFLAVDFEVGLYATNNPRQKWLRIRPKGVGFSPGKMLYDKRLVRGYFQDRLKVSYGPNRPPAGFVIANYAPRNVNADYSVTNTTGFEVGAEVSQDGPGVGASYSASKATTYGFKDFAIIDHNNSVKGIWEYKLSAVGKGKEYSKWSDLWYYYFVDWGMHKLPPLATGPLNVDSEVVWRAPASLNQKVEIVYSFEQTIRKVWWHDSKVETRTRSYWNRCYGSFFVDFNRVQIPQPPQQETRENGRFLPTTTIPLQAGNGRQFTIRGGRNGGAIAWLEARSLPKFARFTDHGNGSGTLSVQPGAGEEGRYHATIRAYSPEGLWADQLMTFDVVNNPPQLQPIGDRSMPEGETLTAPVQASDAEGQPLQLAVEGLPPFAEWQESGDGRGNLIFKPNFEQSGRYAITVTATDAGGKSATETFTLTVENKNLPPVLETIGAIFTEEGARRQVTVRASDPDRQDVALRADRLPPFAAFEPGENGTGTLVLQPGFRDAGRYYATITAVDPEGAQDRETFLIMVRNTLRPLPTRVTQKAARSQGVLELQLQNWRPNLAMQIEVRHGSRWQDVVNDNGDRAWFHETVGQNEVIRFGYGANAAGGTYRVVVYDKAEGMSRGWAASDAFTLSEANRHVTVNMTLP